ncbi:ADP-ribosyltransferase [uncultured Clostridium sp.]|uniref:ADP-ribosyltransferase n=1 Tax=uncultured Clostridium sp. TaxID=59620 RepID=UPI0025F52D70|nr:ADP-ribosyltransferase [uncultured Clostridium sp.]
MIWLFLSSDKKQFEEYKNILGKNSPKTLKEFQEIKYNNIKEWSLLKEKASINRKKQLHAINKYISSESYKINDKLRNNLPLNDDKEFINDLDKALDRMPIFKGDLRRSLEFYYEEDLEKFLSEHEIGEKVTYKEYLSTTKGNTYNSDGQVQIYILNSQKGRDISKYNDGEQEILYPRGSKFKVLEVEKIGNVTHIELKEL